MTTPLTLVLPLQLWALWLPQAMEEGCSVATLLERAVVAGAQLPPTTLSRHLARALGPEAHPAVVPVTLRLGPWAAICLGRQAAAWDLSLESLALVHLWRGPQGQPPRTQMA